MNINNSSNNKPSVSSPAHPALSSASSVGCCIPELEMMTPRPGGRRKIMTATYCWYWWYWWYWWFIITTIINIHNSSPIGDPWLGIPNWGTPILGLRTLDTTYLRERPEARQADPDRASASTSSWRRRGRSQASLLAGLKSDGIVNWVMIAFKVVMNPYYHSWSYYYY